MPQPCPSLRTRSVVACGANGQPRTYRLDPRPAQQAAYRRLAVAVLGLDVRYLAAELRTVRADITRARSYKEEPQCAAMSEL